MSPSAERMASTSMPRKYKVVSSHTYNTCNIHKVAIETTDTALPICSVCTPSGRRKDVLPACDLSVHRCAVIAGHLKPSTLQNQARTIDVSANDSSAHIDTCKKVTPKKGIVEGCLLIVTHIKLPRIPSPLAHTPPKRLPTINKSTINTKPMLQQHLTQNSCLLFR